MVAKYELVKKNPIAKFWYKGKHSHYVRRVVAIINETDDYFQGYELREGKNVRTFQEAHRFIKTYRKDRIARYGDYCRLRASKETARKSRRESTLRRMGLNQLVLTGV